MLHRRMGPPHTIGNVVWMHPHALGHAGICELCSRHIMTWPLATRATRELSHNGALGHNFRIRIHNVQKGYAYGPSREACMAHVHARKLPLTRSHAQVPLRTVRRPADASKQTHGIGVIAQQGPYIRVPKGQDSQLHLSATRIAECMGNTDVNCGHRWMGGILAGASLSSRCNWHQKTYV